MVGYRRPRNLRDALVRAAIPPVEGDEKLNPNYISPMTAEPAATNKEPIIQSPKQLKMEQFLTKTGDHATETNYAPDIYILKSQSFGTVQSLLTNPQITEITL